MSVEITIKPKRSNEYTLYDGSRISDTDDEIKIVVTKDKNIKINISEEIKEKINGIIEDMEEK